MNFTRFNTQSNFRYFDAQPYWLRYGLAVLTVAIAAIATLYVTVIGERAAFLLFFFVIIQTAFWLGLNPGILAMILSLIAVNALVLFPARIGTYDVFALNAGFCFLSAGMIATTSFHRRSTAALWESRQDLDYAQAVGQIGSWRLKVKPDELRWSDENHRIFGIPKGTPLTYDTFLATVHPDDREYVDQMWQAALRGAPYDIEHRLIVAGKVKWVREKAVLEFSKKGLLLGGFGTTQDITAHKRNELALKESRQRYAGIVESATNAIITIDAEQRILLFNAAAEKMFGCKANEAIGDSLERFIPERFRAVHDEYIRAYGRTTGATSRKMGEVAAITGLRADGEEFPIEASISQCDINGEKSFTAILRDVTERVRADIALQEQFKLQDQLAKVAATVPGVICSFRLRPDGSACMPYASPVFESVYGLRPDAVAEDFGPVFTRIHPDDIVHIHETIAESARSLQPWRDSFCYNHPTKGEIWVEGHSIPLREMDDNILWHGYIQDITDRKLAETALRDRESELRLIMDATPALISYLDTEFRYLRVNATYENWFGISAERILGHKAQEIIGEKAFNIVQPYLNRARAGERVSFDLVIPYGTGKPRWVHAAYIPDRDSTGTVKGIVVHIVDIEDIKQAEQKIALLNQNLQRRIEEMQVVFDTVPIGLSIADDATGSHIRSNPANERMLGIELVNELSKKARIYADYRVFQNGRELAAEELPMQRAIRGEAVTNQIIDIVRPDAQVTTVFSNATPLFNEEGHPRGAVGAFLDITELKRVEESLRKSQTQLRLFIEQAPLSIAMLDRDMNYLVTSRRWIEEFGRGNIELIGRNHYEVHPDISAEWKQIHRKAQAGEFLKNDEDLWIQNDGSRHWLRWAAYPWTNQEGETGGIIISCEDITARRKAEQELRTTQARLALIVEEVKAGYWDWDLKTDIVYLSPEWKRQIGFNENELLNQWEEWECRLHPGDRALVLAATKNFIAGHLPVFELEFRLRHKDGTYRWIHCRGELLRDPNNQPYRMLGINLDITDFKKTKELSERRDKMEQSFRLYVAGQTAAAIAHELNQPLTAISSYADVALQLLQTGNRNPQKLTHVIENCALQAQRAGDVIRQLMTVLHKGETISEPIDINISVREALALVQADVDLGTFNIELNLALGLPQVSANQLQIQKVLVNLLRNGLESMQENGLGAGTMTVTTRSSAVAPSMVQVTVCDSGIGVTDTATLNTMFQPFHTTKPSGLGMGLAISRALIRAHGGKMWAEQNAGMGISIHFTLPFVI